MFDMRGDNGRIQGVALVAVPGRHAGLALVLFRRPVAGDLHSLGNDLQAYPRGVLIVRLSLGFVVFALVFYMIGAKFPILAQKVGLA